MSLNAGSLGNVFIRATRPPQTWLIPRDPTPYDTQGYYLLDEWLNTVTDEPFVLVSLKGNSSSRGEVAVWMSLTGNGTVISLTGNSGGPVFVDGAGNINVVGDGTTINIVGVPGTHTLTASVSGTGVVSSIATQDGHFVTPLAGVIILDGGNNLATTGTIGPNTVTMSLSGITQHSVQIGGAANSLTQLANGTTGQVLTAQTGADPIWSSTGGFAQSFPTDSGTAIPSAGALKIWANNAANNAGSSVLFSGSTNNVLLSLTDANNNTLIGKNAGNLTVSGVNNAGLSDVLNALTSGSTNLALGHSSGSALTSESSNVLINHAGLAGKSGWIIVSNGAGIRFVTTDMSDNQFVGINSGNTTLSGTNNNVFGAASLRSVTTSINNEIFGNQVMTTATSGANSNCIFGSTSYNVGVGSNNAIFGSFSLASATSASTNVCIGNSTGWDSVAGTGLLTGNLNILLGYTSGAAYRGAESGNIIIDNGTGLAVVGESNKTKIAGIRGTTTTNNNAVAVLIDSAGQLGTVSSLRDLKDNIADMGSYSDSIRHLRPVVFNYKNHSPESKSVGLIAEEVEEVAPHLVAHDDKGGIFSVKYHDLVPMLLNEFQKHCILIGELQAINAQLLDRLRMLEERLLIK